MITEEQVFRNYFQALQFPSFICEPTQCDEDLIRHHNSALKRLLHLIDSSSEPQHSELTAQLVINRVFGDGLQANHYFKRLRKIKDLQKKQAHDAKNLSKAKFRKHYNNIANKIEQELNSPDEWLPVIVIPRRDLNTSLPIKQFALRSVTESGLPTRKGTESYPAEAGNFVDLFSTYQLSEEDFSPTRLQCVLVDVHRRANKVWELSQKITHSQYEAQAHEIKRIRRHIHPDSPRLVLDLIRCYFNSLFASSLAEVEQVMDSSSSVYYLGYGHGENLGDFVANAIKIAVQIELLDDWSLTYVRKDHTRYGGTAWPDDEELRRLSDHRVKEIQSSFIWTSESFKSASVTSIAKSARFHFFGALVCLLRNVVRYYDPQCSVNIDIADGSMKFTNQECGGSSNATSHESVGRTGEAVRYFVRNYAPRQERVISLGGQDNSGYISIIPIPEDLIINA